MGFGKSQARGFEEVIDKSKARLDHLAFFKVIPPIRLFSKVKVTTKFYKEAVWGFIVGLPNSSIAMSVKVLEVGLKRKYKEGRLIELIDKLQVESSMKDLAHGIRIIRNAVMHEEKEYSDADALEVLRHVSSILNRIYPFNSLLLFLQCPSKHEFTESVENSKFYLANILRFKCPNCGKIVPYIVGTEFGIPMVE